MRRFIYLSLASLAIGLGGCSEDDLTPNAGGIAGLDKITVNLPGAATKTHMDETTGNQVLWTQGDEIGVFLGSTSYTNNKYILSGDGGSSSGDFTSSEAVSATETSTKVAALYPYVEGATYSESKISFSMPAEFTYDASKPTENNKAPMACLIASEAQDKISFQNAGALLDITVKNISSDYNKIVLTSGGENAPSISGNMDIEFSEGVPTLKPATVTSASTDGTDGKSITINFTVSELSDLRFFFPIPAGTYPSLTLTLKGESETEDKIVKTITSKEVVRGKRLYATLIFDSVTGDIATSVNSVSEATNALKNSSSVVVEEVGESENAPVVSIPKLDASLVDEPRSVAFNEISTTSPIKIQEEEGSTGQAPKEVAISVPETAAGGTAPNFEVNLPNSTVTLSSTDGTPATYGEVTAKTAKNTLIIGEGVTVKKLTVQQGNVRLKAGAKIEELVHDYSYNVVYLYHEDYTYSVPNPLPDKFKTMDAAIADMNAVFANGGTYQMTKDMELVNDLGAMVIATVKASKDAILDLNGFTLKAKNKSNIVVKGTLTIKDSSTGQTGKILATADYDINLYKSGLIEVQGENAKLIVESGTIDAKRESPAQNGHVGVFLTKGGDFTMTGGKIDAGFFALSGNGNDATTNSVISIEGGELASAADYVVYLPQAGSTTVKGGTITGAAGGICIQRGTLNISGANTVVKSLGTGSTGNAMDGTGGLANAAVCVAAEYGDCTVSITGGTITGENQAASILKPQGTSFQQNVTVSGATITPEYSAQAN